MSDPNQQISAALKKILARQWVALHLHRLRTGRALPVATHLSLIAVLLILIIFCSDRMSTLFPLTSTASRLSLLLNLRAG